MLGSSGSKIKPRNPLKEAHSHRLYTTHKTLEIFDVTFPKLLNEHVQLLNVSAVFTQHAVLYQGV